MSETITVGESREPLGASLHSIKVEAQYAADGEELTSEITFTCAGRPDDACHRYPDCDCETWDLSPGHDQYGHPVADHAECWMAGWFENGGHRYIGPDADPAGLDGTPAGMKREGNIEASFVDFGIEWEFVEDRQAATSTHTGDAP